MKSKSKHTGWVILVGAVLGAVAGIAAGNVGVWLGMGVAIGIALGVAFGRKQTGCPECAEMHRAHEIRQAMRRQA